MEEVVSIIHDDDLTQDLLMPTTMPTMVLFETPPLSDASTVELEVGEGVDGTEIYGSHGETLGVTTATEALGLPIETGPGPKSTDEDEAWGRATMANNKGPLGTD